LAFLLGSCPAVALRQLYHPHRDRRISADLTGPPSTEMLSGWNDPVARIAESPGSRRHRLLAHREAAFTDFAGRSTGACISSPHFDRDWTGREASEFARHCGPHASAATFFAGIPDEGWLPVNAQLEDAFVFVFVLFDSRLDR